MFHEYCTKIIQFKSELTGVKWFGNSRIILGLYQTRKNEIYITCVFSVNNDTNQYSNNKHEVNAKII
jgi:hypothetical protein